MARPSKSMANVNYHITKAEAAQREAAEKAALTGLPLREFPEVAKDETAHAEYLRVVELLTAAGKNDALFEAVINDYCMLKSDILSFRKRKNQIDDNIDALMDADDIKSESKYKIKANMYKSLTDIDKQIQAAQKKRFDVEKECGFTIASAARNIPKKVESKSNPLLEALRGGDAERA